MFWDSYTLFHITLSIVLHVAGVSTGLWIWYIFPKNPLKHVIRVPIEKQSLLMEYKDQEIERQFG